MSAPDIKLNDGHTVPQLGLGTWQVKDPAQHRAAFEAAIDAGYRHFDTAQAYDNEQFLGEAWKQSGLKRQDIFMTTKIAVQHFGARNTERSFADSLKNLRTDYVDLLLLHFPVPVLRKRTWQAVEAIQATGGARSIGVSNYTIRHLEEMKAYAKVMPAVNQIELHVFLQQPELVKYCQDNDIAVEGYCPLARSRDMSDEVVQRIADKYDKTYAQIMIRWLIEQGIITIPKSVTPSRIRENIDIFDFRLDDADMTALAARDKNLRVCWSPVHVP